MGGAPENVSTIHLPDPPGIDLPGDGVRFHWHRPRVLGPRARRGIIILPILAGDYEVSTLFAKAFAARGYSCLRFERRAEWLEAERAPELLGRLLDRYVEDIRRGIAWWGEAGGPESPLGLFGVSMGAITGTVLAAREPKIGPAVLCLGGGSLVDVMNTSRDQEFRSFRAALTGRLGDWETEVLPRFARGMEGFDPLDVAGRLDPTRVLFVGTLFDQVVRRQHQKRLWQALGRPRRLWLPTGHYSAALFVPLIRHLALRWFDRPWGPSPSLAASRHLADGVASEPRQQR